MLAFTDFLFGFRFGDSEFARMVGVSGIQQVCFFSVGGTGFNGVTVNKEKAR